MELLTNSRYRYIQMQSCDHNLVDKDMHYYMQGRGSKSKHFTYSFLKRWILTTKLLDKNVLRVARKIFAHAGKIELCGIKIDEMWTYQVGV